MIRTEKLRLEPLTYWKITLPNGAEIGEIHIKGEPAGGTVEIGYGVERQYRNRGYMREALGAVTAHLLALDGITAVTARTLAENYASQNVLAACGYTQTGKSGKELVWEINEKDTHSVIG
ncbi:MAG: GNAT family N-acetyltransferase [Oscillospiraceae bacterium]|nr:GNAT family N-acetyltransferase [Oscillospiraceae bacterium]